MLSQNYIVGYEREAYSRIMNIRKKIILITVIALMIISACACSESSSKTEIRIPMLMIESVEDGTYEATYCTWDIENHDIEVETSFLRSKKSAAEWFWNRIFWEGDKTVCYSERNEEGYYQDIEFAEDVNVIKTGLVFGDEKKYENTVGAYFMSYYRNDFRYPFDGTHGKRYPLPEEPPQDILGTKTFQGDPHFISVERDRATVGYFAYETIGDRFLLDLIIATYPLNDVSQIEWKIIAIPEKYGTGDIFVGGTNRTPFIDDKVYLLGYECMIACDIKENKIIEIEDYSKIHELCPNGTVHSMWGFCPTLMMGEYDGYVIIEREYYDVDKPFVYYAAFKDDGLVSIIEKNHKTGAVAIYDGNLNKMNEYADLSDSQTFGFLFPCKQSH